MDKDALKSILTLELGTDKAREIFTNVGLEYDEQPEVIETVFPSIEQQNAVFEALIARLPDFVEVSLSEKDNEPDIWFIAKYKKSSSWTLSSRHYKFTDNLEQLLETIVSDLTGNIP